MKGNIFVLDGGFASELERYGYKCKEKDPLWSSSFLITNPDIVKEIHKNFIYAGANIITTNTYQATFDGFKQSGYNKNEALQYFSQSVKLVETAIHECGMQRFESLIQSDLKKVLIAGSIGPFGASLCDGSEYSGKYPDYATKDFLKSYHRQKIICLIKNGVDILAFETLPSYIEAKAILEFLDIVSNDRQISIKAWISFTLSDKTNLVCLSDNTPFLKIYREFCKNSHLIAIGVNCVNPIQADNLLNELNYEYQMSKYTYKIFDKLIISKYPKPLIVYPNSGKIWDKHVKTWLPNPNNKELSQYIIEWISKGVTFIGGCCTVNSQDIANIKKVLENIG